MSGLEFISSAKPKTQLEKCDGEGGLYEFASNGNCKYWILTVNTLNRNLQVLEFGSKTNFFPSMENAGNEFASKGSRGGICKYWNVSVNKTGMEFASTGICQYRQQGWNL